MPDFDRSAAVDRLRQFQRKVRETVVKSRAAGDLSTVSRSSMADTIYAIDTAVDPILEALCEDWGHETPLVLVAEGMEDAHGVEGPVVFPRGLRADRAEIRVIVDPIDGTRGIMYDKRAAWALAGVAPNNGPGTRLRDIEVAVMTELPTSKMGFGDVLWAIKGQGTRAVRERLEEKRSLVEPPVMLDELTHRPVGRVLTKMGKVADEHVIDALNAQQRHGGRIGDILVGRGHVTEHDVQIALAFQKGEEPDLAPAIMSVITGEPLRVRPSQADTINHGFASVSNFFPGTKELSSRLMEHLARHLIGPADVTRATVFDDQYISTGGQFYELIVGHDRFNADLRPAFYAVQGQPQGLCCHPYDCATLLIAEEAGAIITDERGQLLDGPLDTTTGLNWVGYANPALRRTIEPLVRSFLAAPGATSGR
jgi:fructose-1,6-bisphosphatase/inositol monophosphatase family enzyme